MLSYQQRLNTPIKVGFVKAQFSRFTRVVVVALGAVCGACQVAQPATPVFVVDKSTHSSGFISSAHTGEFYAGSKWDGILAAQFEQAKSLVEEELDVDLQAINLMLVSKDPINREVQFETRRLIHSQFNQREFADRFLHQVMHPLSGTYAALFSSRLQSVLISRAMLASFVRSMPDDDEIVSAGLLTLLLHELVHAADDKQYRIHDNRALSFRASFAQSATYEGHAQWVTRQICQEVGCLSGLTALDRFMFSIGQQSPQLTQPVEAISRNVLEYSYVEGERFINELAKREQGAELIDQLLSSPPSDPIQILSPSTYPDVDRETRNQQLINARTSPLKGVNLRNDPARRQSAVDGFTLLLQAMVSMQLYDQSDSEKSPIEITLMHAESAHTARLFASTLHQNTQQADAQIHDEPLQIKAGEGNATSNMNLHLYRTRLSGDTPFRTAIGVAGKYVVQASGFTHDEALLDDYTIRVLLNLQLQR